MTKRLHEENPSMTKNNDNNVNRNYDDKFDRIFLLGAHSEKNMICLLLISLIKRHKIYKDPRIGGAGIEI